MTFGQKLRPGIMSGITWTDNLFQQAYNHGKHALGIADQGMKTATGIYESLKPAIQI